MAFPEELWPAFGPDKEVLSDDLYELWADKMRDPYARQMVNFLGRDEYHSIFDGTDQVGDPQAARLLADLPPHQVRGAKGLGSIPLASWGSDSFWQS